jgi:hypothetical protein
MTMQFFSKLAVASLLCTGAMAHAGVLPEVADAISIPLVAKPTSRPMTVAYVPDYNRYYIADGGLGPVPDGFSIPMARSEVHVYSAQGRHLQSVKAGLDNRSIYFNPNTHHLESVTYNVSSGAGFLPGCGIFALELDGQGNLSSNTTELSTFNPAFGDAATMPSFDPAENRYFAKQKRSDKVWIAKQENREQIAEITLDLAAAKVQFDDISDNYVAYTGLPGEELMVLDVDHKSVLVFNLAGKFVGRSALPASLKLRANNHYNGLGYANGLMFVYHETEGEFGTYHGYRVSDQAVTR